MPIFNILLPIAAIFVGLAVGLFVLKKRAFDEREYYQKAERLLEEANKEKPRIVQEAREAVVAKKKRFETEQEEFVLQLDKMEQMLAVKTASMQKREARLNETVQGLKEEEKSLEFIRNQTDKAAENFLGRLMQLTGFSRDRIKEEVIGAYEQYFLRDSETRLKRDIEWANESATREAKNVLAEAIYRFADITSVDHGEGKITVKKDEVKGRLIGRGGRVIAFFEELFDVVVVFNDEPNIIIVSCFNLVQREIARLALERLIREQNITEEIIIRTKKLAEEDMDKILLREGNKALTLIGLKNMVPDFIRLVGRLQFRTSYGQNVLLHSLEVGYLARLMASSIGANEEVAFLGGVFHDIGKAIDQEVGGSHDVLSKEILEKYGFSWEITHAAWTHHNAIPQETAEARIVQAADAISAGRPGARAESLERYLAKIKELEATALSFEGTKKVFTIHAGREVRIFVEPEKVSDSRIPTLAQDIAAKVQEKGGYPGRIKIVTIRTTKATDYAR